MASLKDMRVRLASTKATQKITKAMQMVAASKLRRAQAAAEAARPYAERMEKVLGNIAATVADINSAPKLLAGTGQDQVHLLVVCTAERGLCGAFNSSIVRLARERINALTAAGKTVKILCVGRKGADQLRRQYCAADHRGDRAAREDARLRARRAGRRQDHRALREGRVRRRHAVLLALQVGDLADSDRAADHPAGVRGRRRGRAVRGLRIRAGRARHSRPSCCRATSRCRCSARFWKTPRPSRARACRRWTTPPATPAK